MKIGILALFLLFASISSIAQDFGTKKHPMNKATGNVAIMNYWNQNTAEEIELYKVALDVLSEDQNATYKELVSDKRYTTLCEKYEVRILGGPILGDISSKSVSVWVRTIQPAKVEVEVSDGTKKIRSKPVFSSIESDLTAIVKLDMLKPGTAYTYKLIINDKLEIIHNNYSFKTIAENPDSLRIAFGSCTHRWGLGNKQLFSAIKAREPSAMLMIGDIAVQDRKNHWGMHRADYLLRDFHHAWSDFACSIPVYASWDDHDYFSNDKAGIPNGFTQTDKEKVWEVFQKSWVNPSYGFGENGKGVFLKTRIGTCDIIMTDNRYFRSGEEGSFLGEEQMKWFKEQLLNCKGPYLILSCGSMWSDFVSNGKDSWGVNDPEGREEIFSLIESKNIAGVLFISGDRHGARGFTIERESGFEFYEFGAASLGARVGPPATNKRWTTQLYGIDGEFAFGEFTFATGNDASVTFRLIGEKGNVIYKKKLSRSDDLTPNKL
jgi:alkaline phosphatase D